MKKFIIILGLLFILGFLLFIYNHKITKEKPINPYLAKGYSQEVVKQIEMLSDENQYYLLTEDYIDNLENYFSVETFDEVHLKEYITFSTTYELSLKDTVFIVNHGFKTDHYDQITLDMMHSTYYIHEYLERYRNYHLKKQISIAEVITAVNSNLDYDFYTQDYVVDFKNPYLVLVNKYYKLPSDYVPSNLVTIESKYGKSLPLESTVYEQYKLMWNAAKEQGLSLYIRSPYRSYQTQNRLYNDYVARDGKKAADTYSARPGYSEHQTGLAFDVTSPTTDFDTFRYSKEFTWLVEHAHEYGFILRYPEGKEYITGYIYEPWHYRYVGVEVATKMKETGLTYEEYYAYYVNI